MSPRRQRDRAFAYLLDSVGALIQGDRVKARENHTRARDLWLGAISAETAIAQACAQQRPAPATSAVDTDNRKT
jgi:hypothetical protein